MPSNHSKRAQGILAHLSEWGLPPPIQQRIGAFGVLWTLFESRLEPAIWLVRNEKVAGLRPSTDKESVSQWIDQLAATAELFQDDEGTVVANAAAAAKDLMEYRHALVHGWLVPFKNTPFFVRNPSWNRELRKRPSNDAHIDENLLDLAIDCAWAICRFIEEFKLVHTGERPVVSLLELAQLIASARDAANELRHLSKVLEHEKY